MLIVASNWRLATGDGSGVWLQPKCRPRIQHLRPGAHPVTMAELARNVDQSKLQKFKQIMERVYGAVDGDATSWKPAPLKEHGPPRYLWTDAFGVCNFLTLHTATGEQQYLTQADRLVQEVHDVLGRQRNGSARLGPATDEAPLLGGLRIGKADPEGTPDGDGQYMHYLTKWAFALNRTAVVKRDPHYNQLATQLIKAVHPRFVHHATARSLPRITWKMSIDLSQPAVPSQGNLDPFDCYVTYRLLDQYPQTEPGGQDLSLKAEIADMEAIVKAKHQVYSSSDPLDLGEALWITHWVAAEDWAQVVMTCSLESLDTLWQQGYFTPANPYRLAFREFGTTLGIQVSPDAKQAVWSSRVQPIHEYWEGGGRLWQRDKDMSPVMYCASLIPGVWDRRWMEGQ